MLNYFLFINTFGVLDTNYDSLAFKPQSVYVFRAFLLVIVKFTSVAFSKMKIEILTFAFRNCRFKRNTKCQSSQ